MLAQYAFFISLLLWLLAFIRRRLIRKRVMREIGCRPLVAYPHKDPIFGLDLYFQDLEAHKQGNFSRLLQERFQKCGKTFSQTMLGRKTMIYTMEPKNVQAIATQLENFGVAPSRSEFPPTRAFFRHGILTTDGPFWEHSRALIRPAFNKAQIAHLDSLEGPLARMMAYIPSDGSSVDLQPLFKMLVSLVLVLD